MIDWGASFNRWNFMCESNVCTLNPDDSELALNESSSAPSSNNTEDNVAGNNTAEASIQAARIALGNLLLAALNQTLLESGIMNPHTGTVNQDPAADSSTKETPKIETLGPTINNGEPNPAYLMARLNDKIPEYRTHDPFPEVIHFDSVPLADPLGTRFRLTKKDPLREGPYNLIDGKITRGIYELIKTTEGFEKWLKNKGAQVRREFVKRVDFSGAKDLLINNCKALGANFFGSSFGQNGLHRAHIDGAFFAKNPNSARALDISTKYTKAIILDGGPSIPSVDPKNPKNIGLIYYLNPNDPKDPLNTNFHRDGFAVLDSSLVALANFMSPDEDNRQSEKEFPNYNLATTEDGGIPISEYSFEETAVLDFMGYYPQFIPKFNFDALEEPIPRLEIRSINRAGLIALAANRDKFSEILVSNEAKDQLNPTGQRYLSAICRIGGNDTDMKELERAFLSDQ